VTGGGHFKGSGSGRLIGEKCLSGRWIRTTRDCPDECDNTDEQGNRNKSRYLPALGGGMFPAGRKNFSSRLTLFMSHNSVRLL
jgi:hypothetical protein